MPEGISATVADGIATIEFLDRAKRGAALQALNDAAPGIVRKVTRPRVAYLVPEGNARAAGLLDDAPVVTDESTDTAVDGEVALDSLTVAELKAYAETKGIDLGEATKKADIIAAIEAAQTGSNE